MQNELSKALSRIYYSTKGYWKGFSAESKLASAAKVREEEARRWLEKEALSQIISLHLNTFQDLIGK